MFRGETSDINNNYYSQNSNFKTINKPQSTHQSLKDQEDELVEKMKVVAPIQLDQPDPSAIIKKHSDDGFILESVSGWQLQILLQCMQACHDMNILTRQPPTIDEDIEHINQLSSALALPNDLIKLLELFVLSIHF